MERVTIGGVIYEINIASCVASGGAKVLREVFPIKYVPTEGYTHEELLVGLNEYLTDRNKEKGIVIDWALSGQCKYFVAYDVSRRRWIYDYNYSHVRLGCIYSTKEVVEELVQFMNENNVKPVM